MARVVPWADWAEWACVRAWLYAADDASLRRRGVQRVDAWRARGRVPVAVDATAAFVELALADEARGAGGAAGVGLGGGGDVSARLAYAMALTRFVNGISDASQRGARARSVLAVADELGLPRWFVELRHEATHNALPSLACLRLAATHALSYLATAYWEAQADALPLARARALDVLHAYAADSLATLREADAESGRADAALAAAHKPRAARAAARRRAARAARAALDARAAAAVRALVRELGGCAAPHEELAAALLDGGLLAPAARGAVGDGAGRELPPGAPRAAFSADRLLERWAPLLRRCHGALPAVGPAIIIGCAARLATPEAAAEGDAGGGAGEDGAAAVGAKRGADAPAPRARKRAAAARDGGGDGGGGDGGGGAAAAAEPSAAVACAGREATLQSWLLHLTVGGAEAHPDDAEEDADGWAGADAPALRLYTAHAPEQDAGRARGQQQQPPPQPPPRQPPPQRGQQPVAGEGEPHGGAARDGATRRSPDGRRAREAAARSEPPAGPPRSLVHGLVRLLVGAGGAEGRAPHAAEAALALSAELGPSERAQRALHALLRAREAAAALASGRRLPPELAPAPAPAQLTLAALCAFASRGGRAGALQPPPTGGGGVGESARGRQAAAAAPPHPPGDDAEPGAADDADAPALVRAGAWLVGARLPPFALGCGVDGGTPELDAVAAAVTWLVPAPASDGAAGGPARARDGGAVPAGAAGGDGAGSAPLPAAGAAPLDAPRAAQEQQQPRAPERGRGPSLPARARTPGPAPGLAGAHHELYVAEPRVAAGAAAVATVEIVF